MCGGMVWYSLTQKVTLSGERVNDLSQYIMYVLHVKLLLEYRDAKFHILSFYVYYKIIVLTLRIKGKFFLTATVNVFVILQCIYLNYFLNIF